MEIKKGSIPESTAKYAPLLKMAPDEYVELPSSEYQAVYQYVKYHNRKIRVRTSGKIMRVWVE